ncbi:MAG: XisI protein [Thiolinea sp.]
METSITFYQRCIKQLLSEYESLQTDQLSTELIFDDERKHYLVMWMGWNGHKRIHECAIHLNIVDNKVIIQWNDTEELLEDSLVSLGIPKQDIIVGTIPAILSDSLSKNTQSYQEAA